jgi:hypothetical protein
VGSNSDIKRFDSHPTGQPIDIFEASRGRAPVVFELLRSPWLRRASELPSGDGAGKRAEICVEVVWDGDSALPRSFTYRGREHRIDAIVQSWTIERWWWDASKAVSRRCFRVLARGGTFDLAYDRYGEAWLLTGVID